MKVKENAETIIAAKQQAEADGNADTMKELQKKVNTGDASVEDKRKLTEMVLKNINTYDEDTAFGEITWDENNENVFWVKDEEGNESAYEVRTVEREDGTSCLQYFKTELKTETEVKSLPDAEKAGETIYKAYDEDGKEYNITVERTGLGTKLSPFKYTYRVDLGLGKANPVLTSTEDGFCIDYFIGTINLTVVDTTPRFKTEDTAIGTNSNSITDQWKAAEQAEQNLIDATEKLDDAQKKYDEAKTRYESATAALNEIIDTNTGIVKDNGAEVEKLSAQIAELDRELNGGIGDQLLRAIIEGDTKAEADAGVKIAKLMAKLAFGSLTEEEQSELEELKNGLSTGGEMLNVITGVADGIDGEDIKNIIGLLADNTLSAKTRLTIARALESVFQTQHEKAVQELKDAIATAGKEIAEQTGVVGEAAKNAAEKELALVDANLKACLAKEAAERAENLKELADKAAKDAHDAYLTYKYLIDAYASDKQAVEDAKKAYEDAQKIANEAAKAAEDAAEEAKRAEDAAEEARRIADSFPVPSDDTTETVEEVSVRKWMTLAEYAYSLRGTLPKGFGGKDISELTSADFVETVYARYGYTIDLSSNKVEDVEKNGTLVDNEQVRPGDIVCVLAADGSIETFGIYYNKDVYVFYNETSHLVETADCAKAPNGWATVNVIA
ncbi:MAG: hypothetical protein Q4F81_05960 [Eubacteriales bacterium]|nr:hypothetical protein [Eubacteriales bacterium]